jgi:hypothetical protein
MKLAGKSRIAPADHIEILTRPRMALIPEPGFTGQKPGGPSRWSSERSGEWLPSPRRSW